MSAISGDEFEAAFGVGTDPEIDSLGLESTQKIPFSLASLPRGNGRTHKYAHKKYSSSKITPPVGLMEMPELHNYQEARLKAFEDKRINEVWVYPKTGDRPFPVAAGKITVETDFQRPDLERFQQKIETRAGRVFAKTGIWEPRDYDAMTDWVALHLIRNRKSRREFFASPDDFNDRFISEFRKEGIISRTRYPHVDVHTCKGGRFLLTSDHPVIELQVPDERDYMRCFAKSPENLVLFSSRRQPPHFEIAIEDFFNAMVYAIADESLFSHRNDVCLDKLRQTATAWQMSPTIAD